METFFATSAGDGAANEDSVAAGENFAVVLDGATAEPDTDSGCIHGVRWFAKHLTGHLAMRLSLDVSAKQTLADILHDAIEDVGRSHVDTCDLDNLCSPSATVALFRVGAEYADYLVLGDSPVVLEQTDGTVTPIIDDRLAQYTGPWCRLRYIRNVPGGFWVAGTTPDAARHALAGAVPIAELKRAALVTDGVSRLVERYGWTWHDLLSVLDKAGPAEVIALTRAAERATPDDRFIGKRHDDATAVVCRFRPH